MADAVQAEERHRRALNSKVGAPGRLDEAPPHHHVTHTCAWWQMALARAFAPT